MGVHEPCQGLWARAVDGQHRRCFDNAVIESFWSRLQVELLDRRRRWNTRIELANAIFEYLRSSTIASAVTARSACAHSSSTKHSSSTSWHEDPIFTTSRNQGRPRVSTEPVRFKERLGGVTESAGCEPRYPGPLAPSAD